MTLIAAAQMNSGNDVAKNMETVRQLVQEAADRGAKIVGLPENFAFLGDREDTKLAMQQDLDGDIVGQLKQLAQQNSIAVIAGGFQERSDDEQRPYNSSIAISSGGEIAAVYRKIHLFDVTLGESATLKESKHTKAGGPPVVVTLEQLKVGLTICYDLRFGPLYAALVDAGADLVTIPAAFTLHTGKDHWEVLLRSRAIEFQCFVMAPAQFGRHNPKRHSYGSAMIVDPWGAVLARCPEGKGVCVATVDLEYMREIRAKLPALQHRVALPQVKVVG